MTFDIIILRSAPAESRADVTTPAYSIGPQPKTLATGSRRGFLGWPRADVTVWPGVRGQRQDSALIWRLGGELAAEQICYVGLSAFAMDDPVWAPAPFTTSRDRLLAGDVTNRRACVRRRSPIRAVRRADRSCSSSTSTSPRSGNTRRSPFIPARRHHDQSCMGPSTPARRSLPIVLNLRPGRVGTRRLREYVCAPVLVEPKEIATVE